MSKFNEEKLKNFKQTTCEVEKIVEVFFQDELMRIDKVTKDLRALLKDLNHKVKKLVLIYQQKFREEFQSVRDEYEIFQEEISNSKFEIILSYFLKLLSLIFLEKKIIS